MEHWSDPNPGSGINHPGSATPIYRIKKKKTIESSGVELDPQGPETLQDQDP
jgi:hypothetical protein